MPSPYTDDYPTRPSLSYLTSKFGPAPPSPHASLQSLGKPHVESFNFMLGDGLRLAVADLDPVEFLIPESGNRVSLWITDASISKPSVAPGSVGVKNKDVYPTEARQRGCSYKVTNVYDN